MNPDEVAVEASSWRDAFTPRELKEIEFSTVYAAEFNHGTTGHNDKLVIAKLAHILDANTIVNLPPFTLRGS